MLSSPEIDELGGVVSALRQWQHEGAPVQLHPGDIGWFWRFGPAATAAAVRTWSRAGRLLAVGLLDGPGLVRLAVAPDAEREQELARQLAADVTQPGRGVLPEGDACVEARSYALLRRLLRAEGWADDEPWTPLSRDLTDPVSDGGVLDGGGSHGGGSNGGGSHGGGSHGGGSHGGGSRGRLRVEAIGAERAGEWVGVHRAAFGASTATDDRWHAMAAGIAFADARCLVAYDERGTAVASVTVWSAGAGRPGLLEPMGVHRDHRGHGYGTAICIAAAAALRELGSSSATVCTPSANAGAVATYESAGFRRGPQARDLRRSR